MKSAGIRQILTLYWGHNNFRPLQQEIITSVLEGKDTLALLPTGGGKSVCYQVPAIAMEGICIVVSPLIALMKDQVENLNKKGIKAVAIISGMSRNEIDVALENCVSGRIKLLYVSPERLSTDIFIERVKRMKVNLIAVDEAHCISQWGYDFRPAYLNIAAIRNYLPKVPVLALTATATKTVEDDIQDRLQFKEYNVFRKSFERKNLSYSVLYEEDKYGRLLKILQSVPGTAVVYVRTRKRTKEIAQFLIRNKISAGFYHAGLTSEERSTVQEKWMKEQLRVVVSTNAFGMGIDKNNVRVVVHMDCPDSIEAYYQEAGRAGRDEKKSYAVLLYNPADKLDLEQRIETTFPDYTKIKKTYQALGNFLQLPIGSGKGISFDFDIMTFCSTYNLPVSETFSCIKILEMQGLILLNEQSDYQSKIMITAKAEDVYDFQVRHEKYDLLLKVILRSYEGIFEDYIAISENEIAKRAGMTKDDVIKKIEALQKYEILAYRPANDKPQLVFTEERLDQNNLHIDKEHLSVRKARFLERVKAFIHYAETRNTCRSQMLVSYFGERDTTRCGICDYCTERNKAGISDYEFDEIHDSVKNILVKEPSPLEELISRLPVRNENKSLSVIEWLIDNNQIRYSKGNMLEWNDRP